ncbi:MAG TPA: hypothetical protein PK385_11945 [Spirochaetota bacterium]|nr:hypothetical protein [Spirochaetota bacterium]HOS33661.1 hypothetical protein [Spirochaetota bacterium]HOS56755.1 hypothetical protein [Spirochaetota bacterium]HPK62670.1 hypothetical protein [Spirochaetota bacterium]HQF77898.1 hypothetical protein [Spirochaetota bacterium]
MQEFKPMGFGDVIDKTFRLALKNFKNYLKIFAVFYGTLFLIIGLISLKAYFIYNNAKNLEYSLFFNENLYILIILGVIGAFSAVILSIFGIGITTDLFSKSFLGEYWDFRSSFLYVKNKFWSIFASSFLSALVVLCGALLFIIGMYPAAVLVSCVIPALINEDLTGSGSIKRSFELTKNKFWSLFGSFILFSLFTSTLGFVYQFFVSIFTFAAAAPFKFIAFSGTHISIITIAIYLILFIATVLYICLVGALSTAYYVVQYFNQRIKFENFVANPNLQYSIESNDNLYSNN